MPNPLNWPFKDPDEYLDYTLDWSDRLGSDTISTSAWTIEDGDANLVADNDSKTTTNTTIWLNGGTSGSVYVLNNRITTAGGRTMDQRVKIKIQTR